MIKAISLFRIFRSYIQFFAAAPAVTVRQRSYTDPRSAMRAAVINTLKEHPDDKEHDT